jgi:hypothetical protein
MAGFNGIDVDVDDDDEQEGEGEKYLDFDCLTLKETSKSTSTTREILNQTGEIDDMSL